MDTCDGHGDNMSVASGDSCTVYTPTHTTEQDDSSRKDPFCTYDKSFSPCAPSPGRRYLIRHRDSGKVINQHGRLGLENDSDQNGTCYWDCVQTLGWFGFCAFGKYLGRDGNYAFRATAALHLTWEWFVITPQGNEGCHLQSPHWLSLRWVGIGKDGRTLVDVTSSAEAALWEFVEV